MFLDDLDDESLLADIDGYLAAWAKVEGMIGTSRTPYRRSAELLLDRGLALERVPSLAAKERDYVAERRVWLDESLRTMLAVAGADQ